MLILLAAVAGPGTPSVPPETTTAIAPIVGGDPVGPGVWPDAVAAYSGLTLACSGTLIAPSVVLTAGHCTPGISHVVVGASDLAVDGETFQVLAQIPYPDNNLSLDVAVLLLDGASAVPPRALAADCLADFIVDGAIVTVAGFGRTDPTGSEETLLLHEVQVPITDADCSDFSRGCREPGSELIAGGEGLDSCSGDSGGPLYLETPRGTVVAGVVARGAFPSSTACGDGGIYVRTDAIVEWVEESAGILLERPDCEGLNRPPRPSAPRVEVSQGQSASIDLVIDDPDTGDIHTIEVVVPPIRGFVDGDLVFHAEPFQTGSDSVTLRITDDGSPNQAAEIVVPIAVFPAGVLEDATVERPRGCNSVPPGALPWFGLALMALRRKH